MKLKQTLIKGLFFTASLFIVFSIASCKKNNDNDFDHTVTAKVNLINASPDAGSAALYVSGTLRTAKAVNYTEASGYSQTYVGSQPVEIRSTTDNSILASATQQIDANQNYTAYLVGQGTGKSMVFTKDNLDAPSSGTAKIRFLNASSDLPNADLVVNNNVLFTAQDYKTVSNYGEVGAGSLNMKVVSGTKVAVFPISLNVSAGKIYTVIVKGLAAGSGNTALGLVLVAHN